MKSTIFIFTLLLILTNCKKSGTSEIQSKNSIRASQSCNIGKWSNLSGPINLKMSADFNSDFSNTDLINGLNPLEQVAKEWNDAVSSDKTLFVVPFNPTATTGSANLNDFKDGEFGIYKSFSWFANVSSNALAITQFYGIVKSDPSLGTYVDLTHADIIVNYRDYASEISMTGDPNFDYDLPTILIHEMGHFLGLCHEENANSIMAPYYFSKQRTLKNFDITKIRELYLNNQNYFAMKARSNVSVEALTTPIGTPIKGHVELSKNGHCKHFIEGKLVYEHDETL